MEAHLRTHLFQANRPVSWWFSRVLVPRSPEPNLESFFRSLQDLSASNLGPCVAIEGVGFHLQALEFGQEIHGESEVAPEDCDSIGQRAHTHTLFRPLLQCFSGRFVRAAVQSAGGFSCVL